MQFSGNLALMLYSMIHTVTYMQLEAYILYIAFAPICVLGVSVREA
jgi:hypothetical protein